MTTQTCNATITWQLATEPAGTEHLATLRMVFTSTVFTDQLRAVRRKARHMLAAHYGVPTCQIYTTDTILAFG